MSATDEEEDVTFESTLPTDFSLSDLSCKIDRIDTKPRSGKSRITKQQIEASQLKYELNLLQIKLSQKTHEYDNLSRDTTEKNEELSEKLADSAHQVELLKMQLKSEKDTHDEELKRRQAKVDAQVHTMADKQKQFEDNNSRLMMRANDMKRALRDRLEITPEEYDKLRTIPEHEMGVQDFVAVRVHEYTRPVILERDDLQNKAHRLSTDLAETDEKWHEARESLEEKRSEVTELQLKLTKATSANVILETRMTSHEYKVNNYDKVLQERDSHSRDLAETKKELSYVKVSQKDLEKDKAELTSEVDTLKSQLSHVTRDKDYLGGQGRDATHKLALTEERLQVTTADLDAAKRSREELYEKYVESRDRYRAEYEQKLSNEMETIKRKTEEEMGLLRTSTRELFERENRSLKESRDIAMLERDRAVSISKDIETKLELLKAEAHKGQVMSDSQMSELRNDLKLKSFDAERTRMVYDELTKNHAATQTELEEAKIKADVLTKELYTLEQSKDRAVSELEREVADVRGKLQAYESLERELDDVILQAAQAGDEGRDDDVAERVVFSYGHGANVPTAARRRMKQSVELARRCLSLEKQNVALKKEMEEVKERFAKTSEELSRSEKLLSESKQPYNYLIDRVKSRDTEVDQQAEAIRGLEENLRNLRKDNYNLVKRNNEMSTDLERLLAHREEMQMMKSLVLDVHQTCSAKSFPVRNHPSTEDPIMRRAASSAGVTAGNRRLSPRAGTSAGHPRENGGVVVTASPPGAMLKGGDTPALRALREASRIMTGMAAVEGANSFADHDPQKLAVLAARLRESGRMEASVIAERVISRRISVDAAQSSITSILDKFERQHRAMTDGDGVKGQLHKELVGSMVDRIRAGRKEKVNRPAGDPLPKPGGRLMNTGQPGGIIYNIRKTSAPLSRRDLSSPSSPKGT